MRVGFMFCAIAPILLAGCVDPQQLAIDAASMRQVVCIDGVEYVALPVKDSWAIAPHYKPDGTLYTCSDSVGRFHYP